MGFDYTTDKCFFTGQEVLSNNEQDGNYLDGYYYQILMNKHVRTIKISSRCDWKNDEWIKENGLNFIQLIENLNQWSFFERAKTIEEIMEFYKRNYGSL
jgi:hypothetical protein